jgi:hypothetical protein
MPEMGALVREVRDMEPPGIDLASNYDLNTKTRRHEKQYKI